MTVLADPKFSDRQNKEKQKILELNYLFQTVKFDKLCKKGELPSECYKKQLSQMHDKDKLSMDGLMAALPAGKGLILNEKDKIKAAKPKLSNSDLSLVSHKKQTEFAIFLLKLSCTAVASTSDNNYKNTLKKVVEENLEQVRKYSEPESIDLRMKFDTTLLCEKKK